MPVTVELTRAQQNLSPCAWAKPVLCGAVRLEIFGNAGVTFLVVYEDVRRWEIPGYEYKSPGIAILRTP
jgi:hypothetical protein